MGFFKREKKPTRTLEDMVKTEESENVAENGEETVGESEKESAVKEEDTIELGLESKEDFGTNALSCFGWKEDRTDKWMIKCAHIWYGAMSFFWFLFGALTFAPVIFISKKVNVIFKDKTKSLIAAIVIWCVFIGLIVLLFATRNLDKVKDVEYGVAKATEILITP